MRDEDEGFGFFTRTYKGNCVLGAESLQHGPLVKV